MTAIIVDVFSDVVCPWCWIGKRRLELAAALRPDIEVSYRPHAFQLDPTLPPEGVPRTERMLRKFGGSAERMAARFAEITAVGAADGLDFRFDRIELSPNTRLAHRLTAIAAASGRAAGMSERLFRAYFSEALDVGRPEVLARLAEDCGLDTAETGAALAAGAGDAEVDADLAAAARFGISGVPFFIFDGRLGLSGAAAPAEIAEAIDHALATRSEAAE